MSYTIGQVFEDDYPVEAVRWANENKAYILQNGNRFTIVADAVPTLDEVKSEVLRRAQQTFVAKRDAIRWVNGYGFDCEPEDITNFMAAYTPLLVAGAGTTQYKVWLTKSTKGIVTLSLTDMIAVYETVRASQLEAYAWYEGVKAQIEAAGTREEVEAIEVM